MLQDEDEASSGGNSQNSLSGSASESYGAVASTHGNSR